MKNKILILALLLVSSFAYAQRGVNSDTFDQIKAKKVAFITEDVGLTSSEAEKFWPIYNELEKERFSLMEKKRELIESVNSNTASKTEAEYKKIANDFVAIHLKESKLTEDYNTKLLAVLSAQKVVTLYAAEGKFRASLMRQYRHGHESTDKNK